MIPDGEVEGEEGAEEVPEAQTAEAEEKSDSKEAASED